MKKALSILLSLVLVIAALPLAAVESDAATILTSQDGLWKYYVNADNTTVTINSGGSSKAYLGTDTDVTVPSTIDGHPVMIVGNYAFYNYTDLESVTIPNTVTSIGNNAFQNCSALADVDMGSGVLTIGSSAFANCTSLEEIEIGSSVQTINGGAFQACSNLKKVVIPPSVTTINGRYTFYQCNADLKTYITDLAAWCKINFNGGSGDYASNPLEFGHNLYIYDSIADDYILAENIVIPSGITSISAGAFNCCTSIKSVVIPEGVTTINQYSFRGCSNLESVTIPSTLTTLNSSGIFVGCTSLNAVHITDVAAWCNINFVNTEANPLTYAHNLYVNGVLSTITIPGTVSEIKKYAFYGLANDVAFSEGLQKIGNFAFYNATGINNLVLPNSLTTVNDSAFYGNTALESITFGSSLATIGNSMFCGCTAIESITIPNTITAIGNNAFQNCSALADVDMGTGVTSVGSSAFAGCTSLEEIEICSSVQTINGGAFNGCSNLKKVVIPPSVTTINGRYTFYNCHADLKTYITDLEAWCKINFNSGSGDYASNPLEFGHNLYLNGNLVENLVIPSGITSIPAGAFHCCTSIKSVVIPEGVTTINQFAFRNCSNLESITIPSSLTTVSGANVFSGCSSLNAVYITDIAAWCNISFTSNSCESNPLYFAHNLYVNGVLSTVTIPGTVSEIKPYTFYGLANDVAFSEGLQKIGNCAFYNATGIDELVLPNSLTTVGNSVFYNCTALESVTFGNGLATIGNSMFYGCTALESTIIPNTVTAIGNSAFQNCSAIADVDMGSGVTTIGSNAFANCTSLEEIEIGTSVQTINGGAFQACSNLKKVVIPPSVTTINGRYTFYNCHADLKTYITDLTEWCNISFNGGSGDYASNPTEYGRKLYINNEPVTELVIPEDVTKISAGAFHGCTGITKVTIPASVTSINQFAFRRCSDMKHLIVAGQSVSLGNRALEGCDSLEHIYCYIGSTAASFNSSKTAYLGDMDSDGTIDINDIGAVISASAGNLNMTEVQQIVADYNLDGAVDGFDAAELDRYVYSINTAKGDVNQDGDIGLADYAMTKAHLSGTAVDENHPANLLDKSYLTSEYDGIKDNYPNGTIITQQYYCADYDGDKAVDAFDLFYIDKAFNGSL